jgi:uncharacterized protein (TIGR03067 family)
MGSSLRRVAIVAVSASVLCLAILALKRVCNTRGDKTHADLARLQGTWTLRELEWDGVRVTLPETETYDITFMDNKLLAPPQRLGGEREWVDFRVNASVHPSELDIDLSEGTSLEIYRLDGDMLTTAFFHASAHKRPSDFGNGACVARFMRRSE